MRTLCRNLLQTGKYVILVKNDISEIEFKKLENDFKKFIQKNN